MDKKLQQEIEKELSNKFETKVTIEGFNFISGGCINEGGKIKTNQGAFFVKWNLANAYPKMFEVEAKGLSLLFEANEIKIPQVILNGEISNTSYLILELITQGNQQNDFWEKFGESLANLHKHGADHFGLDHNNYIGSIPQSNKYHTKWSTFFIEERLQKQVDIAINRNKLPPKLITKFSQLYNRLSAIFPDEEPALLHGDLWSGNFMINQDGHACIIDPAVYYGNREAELAFTHLFGGYNQKFYDGYNDTFPLEKGIDDRIDIYNLYPLLVHVNLFGGGYVNSVENIMKRF